MNFNYNYILWDFDGVIINSDKARVFGFVKVLENYPKEHVDQLLEFHAQNGGLSRYVKFRYFFEEIRYETISDEKLEELAQSFSSIMRGTLTSKELLISDTCTFIKRNCSNMSMHIVSGSDGDELRFLIQQLGFAGCFKSIQGSPVPKTKLVENLIQSGQVVKAQTCLIGDARNDFDAATQNGIDFYGYNNLELFHLGAGYIHSFSEVKVDLI